VRDPSSPHAQRSGVVLFGQAATVWEENPSDVEQWHWSCGLCKRFEVFEFMTVNNLAYVKPAVVSDIDNSAMYAVKLSVQVI